MSIKSISKASIPRALELAERYRFLNEPEQASSICFDILAIEPENTEARRTLFLATTEQFGQKPGTTVESAEQIAQTMDSDYERQYYCGLARERWSRAKLQQGSHTAMIVDGLRRAMQHYERAEAIRPPDNDDAVLRWNACQRLLDRLPKVDTHAPEVDQPFD